MTRYEKLAGTPERLIDTFMGDVCLNCVGINPCNSCIFYSRKGNLPCDREIMMEWLLEEVEEEEDV